MKRKYKTLEYDKKYYLKNKERIAEYSRKRYNPEHSRDLRLKLYYNISLEQYNDMFISQEGKCAICGRHQSDFKRRLAVDHDHNTGKVRGLLCQRCNYGIGYFQENTEILENVIRYLNLNKN